MTAAYGKLFVIVSMLLALGWCQQVFQQFSDERPDVLHDNSPLKQPGSLRSRPYFNFLSVLYRHDADKSQLFSPYARTRRSVEANPTIVKEHNDRIKRAIVFRPLFVYRQQEVRKQNQRRRRV